MLFPRLIVSSVPRPGTETAAENGLSLEVHYFDRDGEALDLSLVECMEQGTDFSVQVTVTNIGHVRIFLELALTHIFPSGWEIRNVRIDPSDKMGVFLSNGTDYNYQDIRDDRIYTILILNKESRKPLAATERQLSGRILSADDHGRSDVRCGHQRPCAREMDSGAATGRNPGSQRKNRVFQKTRFLRMWIMRKKYWFYAGFIGIALFFCGLGGLFWHVSLPEPLFDEPISTVILDRDGKLLGASIAADEQWRFPPNTQIPEKLLQPCSVTKTNAFSNIRALIRWRCCGPCGRICAPTGWSAAQAR